MSIGELAGHFGLATHVLRHWEEMGILAPAERVGGRRRYRKEHVDRVAVILRAKEAGFSLADIREMLEAPDLESRRVILRRHLAMLEQRIAEAETAKAMVEHGLGCRAEDFTTCPNFLRIVAERTAHIHGHADHGHG
jgi:DNA-binding transcriptional MerR regulator